jgi:hypothetical protein
MDINRFKVIIIGSILALSVIPIISTNAIIIPSIENDKENIHTSSVGDILVDKVYNFTIGNSTLIFEKNIFFEKEYYYDIIVGVVSPHTCDMNIKIIDPEDDPYDVTYESNMIQDDYRTIPFGTALTGNYTIIFEAILTLNVNIHIKIEQGIKCLYDVMSTNEQQRIEHYKVRKFKSETTISYNTTFKSDWYYKFFFQRVSTISLRLTGFVVMDHDIMSSIGAPYIIYRNETLNLKVLLYWFGTIVEGLYTMNITIYCDVPCVNIAYSVIEKWKIADGIDPNDEDPPPIPEDPINGTTGVEAFIPREWTIGMMMFVGGAIFIPMVVVMYRKRKNPVGI